MDAVLSALGRAHDLARLLPNDVFMFDNAAVCRCCLFMLELSEAPVVGGIPLVAKEYYIVDCVTMSAEQWEVAGWPSCLEKLCARTRCL